MKLLLAFIAVWLGHGVPLASGECPVGTHDCVPFYNCVNGVINTSGVGVIDIRYRPSSECQPSSAIQEPGICCKIPGVQPPSPINTCLSNQVCVIRELCTSSGNVNTDGSGLIDIRALGCYVDSARTVSGICCNKPSSTVNSCPLNFQCIQPFSCKLKALTDTNSYSPYSLAGSWAHCQLPGSSNYAGVCCENLTPPTTLVVANNCGVRNTAGLDVRYQVKLQKNDAVFGEFPWQAIIFYTNYTYRCGASLVEKEWLITGAHCVQGSQPSQLKIRLGEWQVDQENEPLPFKDVEIAEIRIHPHYNPENLHNDIALVKLKAPLTLQYHINTLCLPDQNRPLVPGSRCFASGWGKNAFKGQYQTILKKTDLPLVDHYRCKDLLRKTRLGSYFELHNSFLCAGGEKNKDVCKGDGGGPLVCQQGNGGYYFLAGITAWGIDCGQKGIPGVYVDVQKFLDWINSIMYSSGNSGSYR